MNPNPVAPKTDTPATQEMPELELIPKPWLKGMPKVQLIHLVQFQEKQLRAAQEERGRILKALLDYQTTLAAERASRLQADTEQFNAGKKRIEELENAVRNIYHMIPEGNRWRERVQELLSKPSVSPEQETE